MILVFLGPPGSGKGTQAKKLAAKLNIPHIALGDMLREAIRNNSEVGKLAKGFIEAGRLAPDEITIALTDERLKRDDCKNGFILDGYPRSLEQLLALDGALKGKDFCVVYFMAPLEAIIERNSGRLSCPECGSVYHVKYNPPKTADKCDKCGSALYQRKDDNAEVIKTRFVVYEEQTKPLVDIYAKRGKLIKINALGSIEEIFERMLKALNL